jgi:hypothetical protein
MAGEGAERRARPRSGVLEHLRPARGTAAAPLNEVTKRCLRWRDAATQFVDESCAEELGLPPETRGDALRCSSAAST